MNYSGILNIIGSLLHIIACSMLLPIAVGLYYKEEDAFVFIILAGLVFLNALFLKKFNKKRPLQYKDGFVVVTLGWFVVCLYGAVPFIMTGIFEKPIDAFFESVSGFTTTGATVIVSLESLSRTIIFWRSLSHWLGGLGIIVMTIAILPQLAGNMHLYKAEVSGLLQNRIKPRIQETAKALYFIYILLTVLQVLLLKLNKMPLFESFIHAFGTISTGGFSSRALSVSAYNSLFIEIIICFFMFAGASNFNIIYKVFHGKIKSIIIDEEFKIYFIILLIAVILIAFNLHFNLYNDINTSFRHSIFHVLSISSTTGYATVDYDIWPPFTRWILLILMFIGGSSGSTAGGIKVMRILVLFKKGLQELYRLLHPSAVTKIKINQHVISEKMSTSILGFFFLYITVFVIVTITLTGFGIDIISSISAVAATLGNIGPGLGLVGPLNSYLSLPDTAKLLLSCCMLMGRLEIYTVLVFIFMEWR